MHTTKVYITRVPHLVTLPSWSYTDLRMPWKKLWDLTSQQLWIWQKWFSFCLTSHSIFLSHHSPSHIIAVAHIDQEIPCREHHNNIQNWKHKPQGEYILLYVCKANRCALDTLCVIDFRLNYKVRAQRVQSSRSCHDTKCSLLVMRYI